MKHVVVNKTYPNVKKFLKNLPKYGLGEPVKFNDIADDFEKALKDICSLAELNLIGKRMEYNMKNENNPNILSFHEWYLGMKLSKKDSFLLYMMRNFPLKNGCFIVSYNKDRIEELAKTFFSYKK